MTKTKGIMALLSLLLIFTQGCGDSSNEPTQVIRGTVMDGHIYGASVCLAPSSATECDETGPSTLTARDGSFELPLEGYDTAGKILIASGGIDTTINEPLPFPMRGIISGEDVNLHPLSTFAVVFLRGDAGKEEAIERAAGEVGITADELKGNYIQSNKVGVREKATMLTISIKLITAALVSDNPQLDEDQIREVVLAAITGNGVARELFNGTLAVDELKLDGLKLDALKRIFPPITELNSEVTAQEGLHGDQMQLAAETISDALQAALEQNAQTSAMEKIEALSIDQVARVLSENNDVTLNLLGDAISRNLSPLGDAVSSNARNQEPPDSETSILEESAKEVPVPSKIPYITTSAFIHQPDLIGKLKEWGIKQMNVGMLFLNNQNQVNGNVDCSFNNLFDNVGGPGQENPLTRTDPNTVDMLKAFIADGGSFGLTFGGATGGNPNVVDPMDPNVCTGEEFSKLLSDTIAFMNENEVPVSWIDLDMESEQFRSGEYGKAHYDKIAGALKKLAIPAIITIPQYVVNGYWAGGYKDPLNDFLNNSIEDKSVDFVTFMLGQGLGKGKSAQHMDVCREWINKDESKVPKSQIVALFNRARNEEEGFNTDLELLKSAVERLHESGYAGVMFWGMTNNNTGQLDEEYYEEWKVVNEFDWGHSQY